ncbi:hypothetical protein HDU81_002669 [Chytriomyces hyalinus]|nr:hypothetical protein HDU81_002669 [Chytriomyces hyalinus]
MGMSDDGAAMKMLRRVASLVSPLMTKRGWVLPLLREFVPDNANLLGVNVNRGQEIRLRLRPGHSLDTFYDLDFVLGTMLHELTHNIRGPHDAEFYRNLDMLSKEHDDNVAGGWTGAGFDSAGIRLGGGRRKVDEGEARAIALRAALEREKIGKIMIPAGGRKLGGSLAGKEKTMSPGEMAAMAAERRLKDRVWCGSKGDGGHSHVHVISDDEESDSEDDVTIRKGKNAGVFIGRISETLGMSSMLMATQQREPDQLRSMPPSEDKRHEAIADAALIGVVSIDRRVAKDRHASDRRLDVRDMLPPQRTRFKHLRGVRTAVPIFISSVNVT